MKKYTIGYYNEAVERQILNLPRAIAMKYIHTTELLEEFGGNLGLPLSKALGAGLFELRLKGQEGIARVFYCTIIGKKIIMLHSFIKKTDKIPKKELELAKTRKRSIEND
ncbi:MAG: type II toxin-antitoxin system RelE/ParE family toxin [Burkholderiales bacterium]|nr:type II toxin-antitoxin system RelE/ParE family toxin [Burkholderiales bacterium]